MYVNIVKIKAASNDNFIVWEGEREWRLALPRVAANRLARPPGPEQRERESEKESKNVTDCVIRTVNTRWEGESTHSDVAWSHAAILKYTQNRSKNNNSSSAGRAAALMTLTLRHCCFCFSVFAFLFAMPNWQESDTINDIKKNVN